MNTLTLNTNPLITGSYERSTVRGVLRRLADLKYLTFKERTLLSKITKSLVEKSWELEKSKPGPPKGAMIGERTAGKLVWTNGTRNIYLPRGVSPPEGFYRGTHARNAAKGTVWVTNGEEDIRIPQNIQPPEGFVRGRSYPTAKARSMARRSKNLAIAILAQTPTEIHSDSGTDQGGKKDA